MFNKMFNIF